MLALNPEFDSKVLGTANNTAEGYVLKFHKEKEFEHGTDRDRIMLKFKCSKFDEIQNAPKQKPLPQVFSSADLEFLTNEFETHLTFARLQAVKSKLTEKEAKNRQKMASEMYADVV